MWYIFKNDTAVASCDFEPNIEDLASRGEIAIYSDIVARLDSVEVIDGAVVIKTLSLTELKVKKMAELYANYVSARTSIVWVNGRGYDTDVGSIMDFSQAFKTIEVLYRNWNKAGDEPTIPYRVWVSPTSKAVLPHKLSDFDAAQIAGSNSAYIAFTKFDTLRSQIMNAATIEEVNAIAWVD